MWGALDPISKHRIKNKNNERILTEKTGADCRVYLHGDIAGPAIGMTLTLAKKGQGAAFARRLAQVGDGFVTPRAFAVVLWR